MNDKAMLERAKELRLKMLSSNKVGFTEFDFAVSFAKSEIVLAEQQGGGWTFIKSESDLPNEDCLVTLINRAGKLKVKITKPGNIWNGLGPIAFMPVPKAATPAEQPEGGE